MTNFKFKLQKLLDIRIKEEDESKLLYSQAQNEKKIIENKLFKLEESYKKYSDISMAKDTITQKITINYLASLNRDIKDTIKELEEKENKVNEAKKDFIDKRIKRKSLEILKENKISEIKKEEQRLEQITNDEFALYGYIRKISNL